MIVGVSVIHKGIVYTLPKPNRHHHVIRFIADHLGIDHVHDDGQGFWCEYRGYLDRERALEVALMLGQVLDVAKVRSGHLFSEDLW